MTEEEQLNVRLREIDRRLSALERDYAVVTSEFTSLKGDLKDIKDSLSWVTRLIIGSLLLALVTFVVSGGLFVG